MPPKRSLCVNLTRPGPASSIRKRCSPSKMPGINQVPDPSELPAWLGYLHRRMHRDPSLVRGLEPDVELRAHGELAVDLLDEGVPVRVGLQVVRVVQTSCGVPSNSISVLSSSSRPPLVG